MRTKRINKWRIGKGTYISSDANVNSTLLNPANTKNLIEMGAIYPTI